MCGVGGVGLSWNKMHEAGRIAKLGGGDLPMRYGPSAGRRSPISTRTGLQTLKPTARLTNLDIQESTVALVCHADLSFRNEN